MLEPVAMRKYLDAVMMVVNWILAYAGPAVLLAMVWGLTLLVPMLRRVQVPADFDDYSGFKPYDSLALEADLPLSRYRVDDEVAFRISTDDDRGVCFARVVGLPGDAVHVADGSLFVNDRRVAAVGVGREPNMPAVRVPEGCLYVISSYHKYDSWALGPVPHATLMGRVGHGSGDAAAGQQP